MILILAGACLIPAALLIAALPPSVTVVEFRMGEPVTVPLEMLLTALEDMAIKAEPDLAAQHGGCWNCGESFIRPIRPYLGRHTRHRCRDPPSDGETLIFHYDFRSSG